MYVELIKSCQQTIIERIHETTLPLSSLRLSLPPSLLPSVSPSLPPFFPPSFLVAMSTKSSHSQNVFLTRALEKIISERELKRSQHQELRKACETALSEFHILSIRNMHAQGGPHAKSDNASPTHQLCMHTSINNIPDYNKHVYTYTRTS